MRRRAATATGFLDWKVPVAVFVLIAYLGLNTAEAGLHRMYQRAERPRVLNVSKEPTGGFRVILFGEERVVGRSIEARLNRNGGTLTVWRGWREAALRWLRRVVSWAAGEVRKVLQYRRGIR